MITSHRSKTKRLGELLVEKGLITEEQCQHALDIQKKTGRRLGQAIIELGFVKEEELLQVLSKQMALPHIWLRKGLIDPKIRKFLSAERAPARPRRSRLECCIIPLLSQICGR